MASATQAVASGRYQAVNANMKSMYIYILDTKTGKVKACNRSACKAIPDE
jgi:hypothetical protein|tara:strand:+ start:357 stop:506 length:150 start_codon:yes stop_codon:yes gene_type:complete